MRSMASLLPLRPVSLPAAAALLVLAACGPDETPAPTPFGDPGDGAVEAGAAAGGFGLSLAALPGPAAWEGVLPCADCEGIRTTVRLDPDGTAFVEEAYQEVRGGVREEIRAGGDTVFHTLARWVYLGAEGVAEGREEDGTFADPAAGTPAQGLPGQALRLEGGADGPRFFRLTSTGSLEALPRDRGAREAGGEEAGGEDELPRLEPLDAARAAALDPGDRPGRFQARGFFVYMADAALFTSCEAGVQLPVAMEEGYRELEAAYLGSEAAGGAPLTVQLRGRLENREPADPGMGGGQERFLVVEGHEMAGESAHGGASGSACPALELRSTLARGGWTLEAWRPVGGAPGAAAPAPTGGLAPFRLPEGAGGETPTFSWDPGEGRVAGSAGCNRYTGHAGLRGRALHAGGVAVTRRFCEGAMEVEERFLDLLSGAPTLRLDADGALLFHEGPILGARFRPGVAEAP